MRQTIAVFLMALCWSLLTSVTRPPELSRATVHLQPPPTVRVVVQRMPVLPRAQQVIVIPTPAFLPQPVEGCTKETATYYLSAKVDVRGMAEAWSCRSLDEATQYLNFHVGIVTGANQ